VKLRAAIADATAGGCKAEDGVTATRLMQRDLLRVSPGPRLVRGKRQSQTAGFWTPPNRCPGVWNHHAATVGAVASHAVLPSLWGKGPWWVWCTALVSVLGRTGRCRYPIAQPQHASRLSQGDAGLVSVSCNASLDLDPRFVFRSRSTSVSELMRRGCCRDRWVRISPVYPRGRHVSRIGKCP
jgi:hypothetical protein